MNGKACKQTYLGRVVYPAKYFEGVNGGKAFLSFEVYVDGVAVNQDKSKITARIPCTYTIQNDKDPVAKILCNINTGDDDDASNLAGFKYKNVDVLVEGSEKLTQVLDKEGNPVPRAFYKSLEYCTVTVSDKQVLNAYKEDTYGKKEQQKSQHQVPTQAPSERKASNRPTPKPEPEVEEEEPTPAKRTYSPGDRCKANGKEYEYVGGNVEDLSSWRIVEAEGTPPFLKNNGKTQAKAAPVARKSSVKALLEEDNLGTESPFDDEESLPI